MQDHNQIAFLENRLIINMELKELKKKSKGELHALLAESRDRLRELRFKDANRQLKNVREIRTLKKEIAQVMTMLNVSAGDETK